MSKTLKEASPKIKELHAKAMNMRESGNAEYAATLLLEILKMDPALTELWPKAREIQLASAQGNKTNHSLSNMKSMGKVMKIKGLIKKQDVAAVDLAEDLLRSDFLNPSFIELYCDAAEASHLEVAAIATLEAFLKADPNHTDFLQRLGKLHAVTGNPIEARKAYERLSELMPGDQRFAKLARDAAAQETTMIGNWDQEGSFRKSLKDADEAAQLEAENRSQSSAEGIQEVIALQQQKLNKEPDNINLYRPLADSLLKDGQLNEALDVLDRANELANSADPEILRAISNVTIKIYEHNVAALREDGQEEAALEQAEELKQFRLEDASELVERYPNDLGYKYEYGIQLMANNMLDEAIVQFQQSQRNPQKRIDSLFRLGSAFSAKKQYDIAADQLATAASELPTLDGLKKDVVYELGCVLEAQGKMSEAKEQFKTIYSVDIGYRDVAKKIELTAG